MAFIAENHDFTPFEKKVWLSSPTMHGPELTYMKEAFDTNWMSTVGENINDCEKQVAERIGCTYAVALSSGTAALHLAAKLAGVKPCDVVICSDLTFCATLSCVKYEGATPVFVDTEYDSWNMDPVALEKAFELYPQAKVVIVANLYGTPGKMDELRAVADKHGAAMIEDAAESFGATYKDKQTGIFGDIGVISGNGNKIITGTSGGFLLTNDYASMCKARKWSTQSRDNAPWYQHEELGYNYRMSNVIAGVFRGQLPYLEEHIAQKKKIYERYKQGFADLPVRMNPYDAVNSEPNYWLSCMIIDKDAMCQQARDDHKAVYRLERGKTCPTEILETLVMYNVEGRPIWKPLHMQPIYRNAAFVNRYGFARGLSDAYIPGGIIGNDGLPMDVGADIFERGLCLPSDNKMTTKQQEQIIEIIQSCFD